MENDKFFLRSRRLAALWTPAVLLILNNSGLGEYTEPVKIGLDALSLLVGVGFWAWHKLRPDNARLRLSPQLPKIPPGPVLLVLVVVSLGCASTVEQRTRECQALTTAGDILLGKILQWSLPDSEADAIRAEYEEIVGLMRDLGCPVVAAKIPDPSVVDEPAP